MISFTSEIHNLGVNDGKREVPVDRSKSAYKVLTCELC